MRILGIDPGASGAIAFLIDGELEQVMDMPTVTYKSGKSMKRRVSAQALSAMVKNLDIDACVIEQVGAMPGQGVSSMFAFGRAAGVVEGVMAAHEVAITYITPQEWKRKMRVKSGSGKDASRHRAMELWPGKADLFLRKKDDGRAEAALIGACGTDI